MRSLFFTHIDAVRVVKYFDVNALTHAIGGDITADGNENTERADNELTDIDGNDEMLGTGLERRKERKRKRKENCNFSSV